MFCARRHDRTLAVPATASRACLIACGLAALAAGRASAQEPSPAALPPEQPAAPPQSAAQRTPAPAGVVVDDQAAPVEPAPGDTRDEAAAGAPGEPAPPADTGARVLAPGTSLFERTPVEAEPDLAHAAPAATEGASAFALSGYVRGDAFVGKVPGFAQGLLQAGYGELSLRVDARDPDVGDARAELRVRAGQQGNARDLFLDLREAYVNLYVGPVDLRVGHQIIVWGRADAFNPTNNLTAFDLRVRSPIEDDRRVGNFGARAFYHIAPLRLEAVWLPLYVAARYPPIELEESIVLSEDFPAPELENGLYAVRLHLELAAFEASVSYLRGYAPLPGFALRGFTVGEDPPEIRVARTPYEQHVLGFDLSTALSDVLALRAEAAYRHPIDYQDRVHAPRPDLQYVLGVDRAFGPVRLIVQYLGRYVRDFAREKGPEQPLDPATLARFMEPLPRVTRESVTESIEEELLAKNQVLFSQIARVQHLASARVEWLTLHDTLSLSALGLANFTTEEWLLYPKIGYRISDTMTTYAGAEVYVGPSGTLLDLIDERLTAAYAELRYAF